MYVLVVLLVVRFLEVRHVYNDQMDSVFSDPEIRQFGKKNLERLTGPHAFGPKKIYFVPKILRKQPHDCSY